jgi:hypothetical protein
MRSDGPPPPAWGSSLVLGSYFRSDPLRSNLSVVGTLSSDCDRQSIRSRTVKAGREIRRATTRMQQLECLTLDDRRCPRRNPSVVILPAKYTDGQTLKTRLETCHFMPHFETPNVTSKRQGSIGKSFHGRQIGTDTWCSSEVDPPRGTGASKPATSIATRCSLFWLGVPVPGGTEEGQTPRSKTQVRHEINKLDRTRRPITDLKIGKATAP